MAGVVSPPLLSQGEAAMGCCFHSMFEAQHPLLHCTFISSCQIVALVGCDHLCKKKIASPQFVVTTALHIWLFSILKRPFQVRNINPTLQI